MKIQSISPYYKNSQKVKSYGLRNNTSVIQQNKTTSAYQIPYAMINFRGNSLNKIWDEYNWYIRHDRTPAIYSFLKIKETPEVMDKFFTTILSTPDRSRELIGSIIARPRETGEITKQLAEKLPAGSKNLMPFFYDSPYNKAYMEFLDWKVDHAHSVEELLKIRPDWRGEVLLQKYKDLKHNDNFELGNIPKELPEKHLKQIVNYLSSQMEFGIKYKKEIPALKLDNRSYEFAYFTEGRSDKNVFGIFTPEGKKFVLKISTPDRKSLDNPLALGTLAKIDSYLTYNRSRNSAPLCYYNHNKNFSIYKYIEHIHTRDCQHDLMKISRNMPDFYALGLNYNDTVGNKNFFLLNNTSNADLVKSVGFQEGVNRGEWISVDNDHVTYSNRLQPSNSKYHAPLPNGMQICV